jgi:hypothetical protein
MSEPSQPAGKPGPESKPRAAYGNPSMRISDAERAEVSDRLSQHYGEGRLDEAEFGKRLDQAMHAVTQSDLNGLFDDLPDGAAGHGGPAGGEQAASGRAGGQARSPEPVGADCRSRSRRPASRLPGLILLIVLAAIVGNALTHLFIPWILIAAVVGVVLLRSTGRRHRHSPPEA